MIYIMSNCLVAASNEGDGKHCLFGFQFSSVSHGFIDGFWWRLRILVVKIKDFFVSSMFTLYINEGGACTEHVHTY